MKASLDEVSFKSLRIFNKLKQLGSQEAVSKATGIPVHRIGYELRTLEKIAGQKLFHKQNNKIILTDAGIKIANLGSSLEEPLNYISQELGLSRYVDDENLNIATTFGIAELYLPKILRLFIREKPKIKISISSNYLDLTDSKIDLVIGPPIKNRSDLSRSLVKTFEYNLYASKGYLDSHSKINSISDLKGHKFLMHQDNCFIPDVCSNEDVVFSSYSFKLILEMTKIGMGICCIPDEGIQFYSNNSEDFIKIPNLLPIEKEQIFCTYRKVSTKISLIENLEPIVQEVINGRVLNERGLFLSLGSG